MTEKIVSDIIDSNVFVVEKNGKFLIFDAGAKTDDVKNAVESIMKKIGQPHQKPKVLGVFLTHGHYDHCFFAQDYAKTFGCKIYASRFAKEYLQNPDWNYSEGKFWIEDFWADFAWRFQNFLLSTWWTQQKRHVFFGW